jgi:hypothetical protein
MSECLSSDRGFIESLGLCTFNVSSIFAGICRRNGYSVLRKCLGQQGCICETTQSLKISVADCPDVNEGYIDGYGSFSSLSFDSTDRDDMLARSDELFSDEANVKSSIEVGEKALGHVLEALEVAPSNGHPFLQIVYNLWGLETSQWLAMSWNGRFVECADTTFVLFFMSHFFSPFE